MNNEPDIIKQERVRLERLYDFYVDAENRKAATEILRRLKEIPQPIPGKNAPPVNYTEYLSRRKTGS